MLLILVFFFMLTTSILYVSVCISTHTSLMHTYLVHEFYLYEFQKDSKFILFELENEKMEKREMLEIKCEIQCKHQMRRKF